jgi:hypothetical protein
MSRFDRRVVVLGPGEARACDPGEWRDALVVVEDGAVEVEDDAGGRVRFGPGAVVTLDGVAARALHNAGPGRAVLRVVSRRLRAVS